MAAGSGRVNGFAIGISVAVVAVVGLVVGLVVWMNATATDPGTPPSGSQIEQDTGAIVFGDGPDTVETYVDVMCPYCGQFEQAEGSVIKDLVARGEITLKVHPVAILDRASQGTEYSSRAASALYAVAGSDPGNAYAFLEALFRNQPEEGSTGLTDDQIVEIARGAGVTLTPELEESIRSHEFRAYATSRTLPEGARGTPTVLVNGDVVALTFDPQKDIVARLSS